jgi:hypothetical protein
VFAQSGFRDREQKHEVDEFVDHGIFDADLVVSAGRVGLSSSEIALLVAGRQRSGQRLRDQWSKTRRVGALASRVDVRIDALMPSR